MNMFTLVVSIYPFGKNYGLSNTQDKAISNFRLHAEG